MPVKLPAAGATQAAELLLADEQPPAVVVPRPQNWPSVGLLMPVLPKATMPS